MYKINLNRFDDILIDSDNSNYYGNSIKHRTIYKCSSFDCSHSFVIIELNESNNNKNNRKKRNQLNKIDNYYCSICGSTAYIIK